MDDDEYERPKALLLNHRPIRPARNGFMAECMFSSSWERFMHSPPVEDDNNPRGQATKLEQILSLYPHEITQRQASIAASFVTWLGTNNGLCFLRSARDLGRKIDSTEHGFVAAWAIENRRLCGVNSSVRTIEAVLADDDHGQTHDLFSSRRPNVPVLTAADCEVVETLVSWLATHEGLEFVTKCETEIANLRQALSDETKEQRQKDRKINYTTGDDSYAP